MRPRQERRPRSGPGGASTDQPGGGDRSRDYQRTGQADQNGQLDLFAGRSAADGAADAWWTSTAMAAIQAAADSGVEFQAADLVETYGLAEPDSPKRWGALFGRASRAGVIVPVGVARSKRPSVAGALVRTWRGAQ